MQSFLQAGCPSCRPTNSVKALKAKSTEGKTTKGNNPQNFAPSLWGIRAPNTWFLRPTRKPKQQLNQLIHFSRAHG